MPIVSVTYQNGSRRTEHVYLDDAALAKGRLAPYDGDDLPCDNCGEEIVRRGLLVTEGKGRAKRPAGVRCPCGAEHPITMDRHPPPLPE